MFASFPLFVNSAFFIIFFVEKARGCASDSTVCKILRFVIITYAEFQTSLALGKHCIYRP